MPTSQRGPSNHGESHEIGQKNQTAGIETAVNHISRSIHSCAKLSHFRIRWDIQSQRAFVGQSSMSKLLHGLHTILFLFHCGFCLLQMISIIHDERSTPSARVYIQMVTLFSSIPVLVNGIFIISANDMAACINIGIPFFRNYEEFLVEEKKSSSARRLPLLLQFIQYSISINCILYFLLLLARPESPEWITSILPSEELQKSFMMKLLVLPFYIIWLNGTRTGVIMVTSFIFFFAVWAQEVLKDLSERVSERSHATALREDLSYYSQMRILMKIFDRAISTMIPAAKLVVIIPATFSLYALVKLEGLVSMFCVVYALDTTFLLELVLSILAQPFVYSSSFLQRAKMSRVGQTPLMRRRLKAMKPIAATVGNGMYFVDKKLMLTVLEIIVTNAVNVLLVSGN